MFIMISKTDKAKSSLSFASLVVKGVGTTDNGQGNLGSRLHGVLQLQCLRQNLPYSLSSPSTDHFLTSLGIYLSMVTNKW